MLALITLATWEVVAVLALIIALFTALLLHARRWSVKQLVKVVVHYKDGTRADFVTLPRHLKHLYAAIAGNPRSLSCYKYDMDINRHVAHIALYSKIDLWSFSISPNYHFAHEKVLWNNKHALLVNVLRDFGLEDDQPLPPRLLSIASNQRLSEPTMRSVLERPVNAYLLTDTEVAYLERLDDCLRPTSAKKWARSDRLTRFSGKLPGTDELVMELIATDGGKEKVIACINRDWQPEPVKTPPEYRCTPQD